ncbi:hypothetical protein QJS10_CPB22g01296 [Acorus calamus]|uniref:Uncharacterized protein n=1 Tax=Acorus calamus TaxID=4465 RepID=A0AAV9BXZ2_ACOCL|nr:hypothetical protein QJS10_CPB22g01296 [Acorus calamus]
MKLKRAGLRFAGKNKCSSMDVSFKDGVIEISTLSISGRTVPILRNLIAFEQCYPFTNNHVTFFADLMDRLIKTSRHVSILEEAGILRIGLNSHEEVAYFFHRLCMNVYYNNGKNYLRNVYNNVAQVEGTDVA